MNKIPKAYQSSTPYYQLFFYSAFLAVLLAAFVPMAQASPCGPYLGLDNWNHHTSLESENAANNDLQRQLKTIPTLKEEPVFELLENGVLKVVGEVSITPIVDSMNATVSLSLPDMVYKDIVFVGNSAPLFEEQSVIYRFSHKDVEISYLPKTMQLLVKSSEWTTPKSFRLNIIHEPARIIIDEDDSAPGDPDAPRFPGMIGPI